ncbi:MAG: hypothetical protein HXX13_11655 [Bacteroidetes bacterium]|nr:hypothetical protein [Bacteroidota bacterium]
MKLSQKISILVIVALASITSRIDAQPEGGNRQKRMERIDAQRVAFITDRLQLTPSEAQVFWPVFNEYDAKRKALTKNFHKAPPGEEKRFEDMSDKEASEAADNQLVEAQKLLDLRKEYHAKFKSVLPAQKVLGLYESEKDFQRHLIDQLKEGRGQGPGKGKGPGSGRQLRDRSGKEAPDNE